MKKIQIYLISLIVLVFALNYYHVIQQGTYRDVFIPMAESLIEDGVLANHFFPSGGATYPLWGYVFLILPDVIFGTKDLILLFFQLIACFFGIQIFYKTFDLERKLWHLSLLLPFIALMSTRMPDAPAGFLLLLYVYNLKKFFDDGKSKYIIFA
ncbi:MAG: hypothetical protein K8F24_08225, partial [Bacteroidales bacterium]|nr:hypothetical protein [Bacteroidales bacterium]